MPDVFADPAVQAGISVVILIVLIAAAFWVVSRFRDYAAHDQQSDQELLTNLREMHRRGDISDAEFRTIQSSKQLGDKPTVTNPADG